MFKINNITNYLKYVFIALLAVIATQAIALDENAMIEKMRALDWQTSSGKYSLTGTGASVITSIEEYLIEGEQAHKYVHISEGHGAFKPDAVVVRVQGPSLDTQVFYKFHEIGFIEMDDWAEHIDKDALITEIKSGAEEINRIKEKEGYPTLYVDDWVQEPYLDERNATVYWAISVHDSNGGSVVNAKAIKLGKKGFTEIVWMGTPAQFTDARASLSPALAAYQYDEGLKYADFVSGTDTVAAVGVGALAYKLITGKAKKSSVGLLAFFAIFAKKLWFLIFIPFLFFWKRVKGFFMRGNQR
uniref:Membrane-anchored protein n=1 Tax=Candidatus Kentrum sp. LFY TaxID=2126342 RepID=A0A450VAH2_9GAMM|nr:MAG: Protein of unknown function (DUF2167) [Candidatus Kentron sp. LFY]